MTEIKRTGEYTTIPSPKEILGCFIESGFGRQVPGMWSEMIYNRSFIDVPAYKNATWDWLGLDSEHYNSAAPFWHSGYEEFDWRYIGGTRRYRTCGTQTFKGTSCTILGSADTGETGVTQDGIHLEGGREYVFRIFTGASGWQHDPGLNGFGDNIRSTEKRILSVSIGDNEVELDISGSPREHKWCFTANSTGVYTLKISYLWKGDLILAYVSMMPADNMSGWRRDIVQCLREAGPTVVRFPGGCFTSFYNWRSSVGPRERREPQDSFYWGGIEENDVGLGEFLTLAELCGFEGQICFNMMTSTPFDARCMVEYLNAPSDVGYGRLRKADGREAPWNVRLFECDNEPNRKWSAEQYAQQCVDFAREMREVTPEAEFMLAAYAYKPDALPAILEIAGGDINYVIHRAGHPEFVARILPMIREYNAKTGRNIRLVNTEWLPSCGSPEPFDEPGIETDFRWRGRITNDYDKVLSRHQISWNYAVNGARRILDYISYGGEFALANFNNMANTWGQNIVEGSKDGAWLSCMGQIFAFFHRNYKPCTAALTDTGDPLIYALLVKDSDGDGLYDGLYIVNCGGTDKEVTLPGAFTAEDGLTAPRRSAHITEHDCPVTRITPEVKNNITTIPALSVLYYKAK